MRRHLHYLPQAWPPVMPAPRSEPLVVHHAGETGQQHRCLCAMVATLLGRAYLQAVRTAGWSWHCYQFYWLCWLHMSELSLQQQAVVLQKCLPHQQMHLLDCHRFYSITVQKYGEFEQQKLHILI